MRYLILIIFLFGCNNEQTQKEEVVEVKDVISVRSTNNNCTWWEIPQYYEGVPKYSGPLCTYTNKHIPNAYFDKYLFYVTTDNTQDDNFYVYAHKGEEKELVHTIENWNDPHTNAAIIVLPDGKVRVDIASRGLDHKFQSGKVLISKTPYQLDFECIEGCESDNFEAYPQLHNTSWGFQKVYTHYLIDNEIHPSRNIRTTWTNLNGNRQQLLTGAHYNVSLYSDGFLYVFYNYLVEGKPDERINLYAIKTNDGFNWTTLDDRELSTPISYLDNRPMVHESEGYVYLKDLTVFNGRPRFLFVESTSFDPTQGTRQLKEFVQGQVTDIYPSHHNYSSAAYIHKNGELYVIANNEGQPYYNGGGLSLMKLVNGSYKQVEQLNDGNYNYIRKVFNTSAMAVSGLGESDVYLTSEHVIINLD